MFFTFFEKLYLDKINKQSHRNVIRSDKIQMSSEEQAMCVIQRNVEMWLCYGKYPLSICF